MNKGQWIEKQLSDFDKATGSRTFSTKMTDIGRIRTNNGTPYIVIETNYNGIIILNMETGKTAKSKCSKTDEYDFRTGLAIAWARYKGENIRPEFYVTSKKIADCSPADTVLLGDTPITVLLPNPKKVNYIICLLENGETMNVSKDTQVLPL